MTKDSILIVDKILTGYTFFLQDLEINNKTWYINNRQEGNKLKECSQYLITQRRIMLMMPQNTHNEEQCLQLSHNTT